MSRAQSSRLAQRTAPLRVFVSSIALLAGCGGAATGPAAPHPTASAAPTTAPSTAVTTPPLVLLDPPNVPHADAIELPNDMHLTLVERPSAVVEVRAILGSGSASDGSTPGLAEISANLVADTYASLAKSDARAARSFAIVTRPDAIIFSASVAPDGLAPTIAALGEAFTKPKVDVPAVRAAASHMQEDVRSRAADLATIGERLAQRDLFLAPIGRHPYSISVPSADEVKALDGKAAKTFLESHFVARNLSLVVVGPGGADEITKLATEAFAKASPGPVAPLALDEPSARPRPVKLMLVDDPRHDPALLTIGRFAPAAGDASTAARLYGALESKRLRDAGASEATARIIPFKGARDLAIVEARVRPADIAAVVGALRAEGDVGAKDIAPTDLVAAKNVLTGELARSIDPPAALADALATALAAGGAGSALEKESFEIGATGGDDVRAAAREMLSGDEIVVVVGDAKALAEPLSELDTVDVLDPAQNFQRVRSVTKPAPAAVEPAPAP